MRCRNAIALLLAVQTLVLLGARAEDERTAPLYPVQIEHEFGDGEAVLREVIDLVLEKYYTDAVDEQSLWWGAVEGVLRRISPPGTPTLGRIWTPEDYEDVHDTLRGVQHSIGIRSSFNPNDGSLTVTEVLPGGPSETLLQPQDRILRIDGEALRGLGVAEIDELLKGEAGTEVTLKIVRDIAVFDLAVPRAEVEVPSQVSARLNERVLYVAIRRFSEHTDEELREVVGPLAEEEGTGLILDLRGNSGGVLNAALRCGHLFIPKGHRVLRTITQGGHVTDYGSPNEAPYKLPVVLLVDGQTASAAEVLAAALHDNLRAPLVGEATYGKASMEQTFTITDGYRVRFTIGALYSPLCRTWHERGLQPEYPLEQDAGIRRRLRNAEPGTRLARDGQLRMALQVLSAILQ